MSIMRHGVEWSQRGEGDRAVETAARVVERTRGHAPMYMVDALRIVGMVLMQRGQSDEAGQSLAEGLEMARCLPYPYGEARLLHELDQLERQRGEMEHACQRLEEALFIFQRLGAKKDVERTKRILAQCATARGEC